MPYDQASAVGVETHHHGQSTKPHPDEKTHLHLVEETDFTKPTGVKVRKVPVKKRVRTHLLPPPPITVSTTVANRHVQHHPNVVTTAPNIHRHSQHHVTHSPSGGDSHFPSLRGGYVSSHVTHHPPPPATPQPTYHHPPTASPVPSYDHPLLQDTLHNYGHFNPHVNYPTTTTEFPRHYFPAPTITGVLEEEGATTLLDLLDTANLTEVLDGRGPYTLFAPSNEAFEKLDRNLINTLTRSGDEDLLRSVLLYHVVPRKLFSKNFNHDITLNTALEDDNGKSRNK